MRNVFLLCVLSLALTACGSSNDSSGAAGISTNGSGNSGDTGNPGVASASDAFVDRVLALVATNPEHTEPGAIDSVVVTTPDNSEPIPIL